MQNKPCSNQFIDHFCLSSTPGIDTKGGHIGFVRFGSKRKNIHLNHHELTISKIYSLLVIRVILMLLFTKDCKKCCHLLFLKINRGILKEERSLRISVLLWIF